MHETAWLMVSFLQTSVEICICLRTKTQLMLLCWRCSGASAGRHSTSMTPQTLMPNILFYFYTNLHKCCALWTFWLYVKYRSLCRSAKVVHSDALFVWQRLPPMAFCHVGAGGSVHVGWICHMYILCVEDQGIFMLSYVLLSLPNV